MNEMVPINVYKAKLPSLIAPMPSHENALDIPTIVRARCPDTDQSFVLLSDSKE
jgi:hypothetical protein